MTFGLAFALSGFLIPQILIVAFRRKLFDGHDVRKIHKGAVPRLGGIAFVPSIILTILFVIGVNLRAEELQVGRELTDTIVPLLMFICSFLLLYMVGMGDDLVGLRYSNKFVLQILAAAITIISGVWLGNLEGLFGVYEMPEYISWPLTIVLIVYIVNALNLIDGIDGLAAGLSTIALCIYGVVLYVSHAHIFSLLAFAGVGALFPFLYYNIFGKESNGKKIFMGDTGSLTLGMLISFLAIEICNPQVVDPGTLSEAPMVVAFSPIMIPLLDVLRVALRRLRKKKNPFMPDRCHIHHKLLAVGFSSRKALLTILLTAVAYTVANIFIDMALGINWTVAIDIVSWILLNMLLTRLIRAKEKRLGIKLYE